ncbi:MAG TPA: hypothetical protein VKW06_16145 [Candidatus Angelobacter sp.]|nr:hypothetical protein [Candidatus Angelobacter sp.]
MIRFAQNINPFYLEELLLSVGLTRFLKVNHTGDIEMGLLPRKQIKETPPAVQLTARERFEIALQRVKETDASLQEATNEHAEFLAKNRNRGINFSSLDVVHEMRLPIGDTLTEQMLRERVGNALKEFNQALATFAEEKMLCLREGLCI